MSVVVPVTECTGSNMAFNCHQLPLKPSSCDVSYEGQRMHSARLRHVRHCIATSTAAPLFILVVLTFNVYSIF